MLRTACGPYTLGAAYTLSMDDRIGSIEIGKFADFCVLGSDPSTVEPEALKDVVVDGTMGSAATHLKRPPGAEVDMARIPLVVLAAFGCRQNHTAQPCVDAVWWCPGGRACQRFRPDQCRCGADRLARRRYVEPDQRLYLLPMGSGLEDALIKVLGRTPAPDLIVIEASGVSDPGVLPRSACPTPCCSSKQWWLWWMRHRLSSSSMIR